MSDTSNTDSITIGDPTAEGATLQAIRPEMPQGSLMDQLGALFEQTEQFTGDIISTGGQIRLQPGEETVMPLGTDQTWILMGAKMGLLRAQYRDQDGMMVLSINISTLGERIGVIGPVDEEHPKGQRIALPCYVSPGWATWWTWVHMINTEFMNPNPEMVKALEQTLKAHPNYKVYTPRNRPGAPTRERTATILWDYEPKGDDLQARHNNGLGLADVILLPDVRDAPLWTSYEKDGVKHERPGFTGFVDVLMHNTKAQMAAQALPADTPNRADIQRQANSRLSLLTGTDERTDDGYSLRPTIGRFAFVPPAKATDESDEDYAKRLEAMDDRLLAGDEVSLFPIRDEETTTEATAPGTSIPTSAVTFGNTTPAPTAAAPTAAAAPDPFSGGQPDDADM